MEEQYISSVLTKENGNFSSKPDLMDRVCANLKVLVLQITVMSITVLKNLLYVYLIINRLNYEYKGY